MANDLKKPHSRRIRTGINRIFRGVATVSTPFTTTYDELIHFGEDNDSPLDIAVVFLLALTPLLQYYMGIVDNMSISILMLIFPYLCWKIYSRRTQILDTWWLPVVAGIILFFVFRVFVHGLNLKILLFNTDLILLFAAAALACLNIRAFIKISAGVAALASVVVIIQTVSYYLFGIHLQFAPTDLFTEGASDWILQAQTGVIGITQRVGDLYRPSAFFMEPSHLFLYVFPQLFLVLLSPWFIRTRLVLSVLFSIGIILTTSGMGIVTVIGAWGIYVIQSNWKLIRSQTRVLFKPKVLLLVLLVITILILIVILTPPLRSAFERIFDLSARGAISGRTRLAMNELLTVMNKGNILTGLSHNLEGIEFNMPGFAATLYKYGIIGVVLSYWAYLYGAIKLKTPYVWISLLVIGVSFFSAQTHGTYYMMYYTFFILAGWYELKVLPTRKSDSTAVEPVKTLN